MNNPYIKLFKELLFLETLNNDIQSAKELLNNNKDKVGVYVINQWRHTFPGISLKEAKELYERALNGLEVTIYEYVGSRFTWESGEVIRNKEGGFSSSREEVLKRLPDTVRVIFEVKQSYRGDI